MKKVFSFVAVLLCSVSLMAEETVIDFRSDASIKVAGKVYDGTTVAQLAKSTTFTVYNKVSGKEDVAVEVKEVFFDNKNVGYSHEVKIVLQLTGSDASAYTFAEGDDTIKVKNGRIEPKELAVDTTGWDIDEEKMFKKDSADAKVNTPAALTEGEVIEGDEVELVTTAFYDNAAVGSHKTIKAYFSLKGADAANYKVTPVSEIYSTEGIIAAWVTPTPFEDGSYFHTSDIAGVCPDDIEYAAYKLESGNVTAFSIYYGEDAKNVGFEDVELGLSELEGNIKIVVPADAPCGSYSAEVVLTYQGKDEVVCSTGRLPLNFIVKVAAADIVSIYDDVVGVRDMDCRYVAYQWYKDGAILEGATKAYYQQEGGLEGDYSLKVTTVDGENYLSCETHFGPATNVAAEKSFDDTIQIVVITARSGVRYNVLGEIVK